MLTHIDAALVWGHNSKTYLYSGTMYWRVDEDLGRVEPDYPRDMAMWKGIGYNIDAAFQWKDGKTYFFKGKGYWRFNDWRMSVEHEDARPSAQFWMGCPREATVHRAGERSRLTGESSSTPLLVSSGNVPACSTALAVLAAFVASLLLR